MPELDNNWDAISAVAEWAGVIVGAIIVPLVVWLQHKWDSNKEEIALSNLVTIDQLKEFEQKFAPLLNEQEQESDKALRTIKPELPMREQQLLQFLAVSMGGGKQKRNIRTVGPISCLNSTLNQTLTGRRKNRGLRDAKVTGI